VLKHGLKVCRGTCLACQESQRSLLPPEAGRELGSVDCPLASRGCGAQPWTHPEPGRGRSARRRKPSIPDRRTMAPLLEPRVRSLPIGSGPSLSASRSARVVSSPASTDPSITRASDGPVRCRKASILRRVLSQHPAAVRLGPRARRHRGWGWAHGSTEGRLVRPGCPGGLWLWRCLVVDR
jgi:hypothetical protein